MLKKKEKNIHPHQTTNLGINPHQFTTLCGYPHKCTTLDIHPHNYSIIGSEPKFVYQLVYNLIIATPLVYTITNNRCPSM